MPKCERYIGMDYSGAETPTSIGTPLPLWPKWQDQNGAEVAEASRLCSACISGGTPLPGRPSRKPRKGRLEPQERTLARVEGWILGVA